jgi:hypothetical protein
MKGHLCHRGGALDSVPVLRVFVKNAARHPGPVAPSAFFKESGSCQEQLPGAANKA